ncbi:MAG: cation transporter [Candidatus Kapaibacteriota bacterium]|jgi:Co/Zn/Cd efflux system component
MSSSSRIRIDAMDCPSEEAMIRMALQDVEQIHSIEADFPHRILTVIHDANPDAIMERLYPLGLGAVHEETIDYQGILHQKKDQSKALKSVLAINAGLFLLESIAGYLAGSIGLFADSLDMLADAIVYGLSLLVISGSRVMKSRIAKMSGIMQLSLGIFGLIECLKRTVFSSEVPEYSTMILISCIAMAGNYGSMRILQQQQSDEPHMQASMIFTSTDILVNAGVILAGIFTLILGSKFPDLIIGIIVFAFVLRGAFRILRLR